MAPGRHRHGLVVLGVCALVVAFASATQDIAIDAWRIEIAPAIPMSWAFSPPPTPSAIASRC